MTGRVSSIACLLNRPLAEFLKRFLPPARARMPTVPAAGCLFCAIVAGEQAAAVVHEDEHCVAFLDIRPVFKGHVLLVPREHVDTLPDLPGALLEPFFSTGQALCR